MTTIERIRQLQQENRVLEMSTDRMTLSEKLEFSSRCHEIQRLVETIAPNIYEKRHDVWDRISTVSSRMFYAVGDERKACEAELAECKARLKELSAVIRVLEGDTDGQIH